MKASVCIASTHWPTRGGTVSYHATPTPRSFTRQRGSGPWCSATADNMVSQLDQVLRGAAKDPGDRSEIKERPQDKNAMVYKYGCSDPRFRCFGGMHLLLWRSIQEAKQQKLALFDFGRWGWTNFGLIAFKDRWGTARSNLLYSLMVDPTRYQSRGSDKQHGWKAGIGRRLIPYLPDTLLRALGTAIYRHVG